MGGFRSQGTPGIFSKHIHSSIPVSNSNLSQQSRTRALTPPPKPQCSRPLQSPLPPPVHYGFKTSCLRSEGIHASSNFTLYIYALNLSFPIGTFLNKALWNSAHLPQCCFQIEGKPTLYYSGLITALGSSNSNFFFTSPVTTSLNTHVSSDGGGRGNKM